MVTPTWGDDPIWRAYFSNGWFNHQLVLFLCYMIGVSSTHCARNEMGKEYHHLIGVGTPSVTCFVDPSYLDHPNKEGNEEAYPLHSMIGNCWNLECTRCLQICNSFLFRIGLFGTFYVSWGALLFKCDICVYIFIYVGIQIHIKWFYFYTMNTWYSL